MDSIAGYARTGRIQLGPGSDLVEVQSPDGARLTAIQFHAEHRGHNAINSALTVVLGFLESPMVTGLTELRSHDRDEGAFVYPTGHTWSVAEVIRTLGDLGECAGVRAGVELMHAAGQILIEAAETGEAAGVYSHGGLTPWRVMLSAEGAVQIIGHALPQVEILTFHEDPNRIPREDAFRYCPPERMESRRENFSSDLFGLALIAFELMTGKPVYDGLVNDIRAKAARGETSRRIHQFREMLPDSVRELLTTALRPDIRDRFGSGADFVDGVDTCLRDPYVQGASLRDVMQRASRMQPRTRQELDPGRTSMLSKEELRRLAEQEDAPAPKPARTTVNVPAARPPPSRAPEAAPPALTSSTAALSASSARVGLPQRRAPPRLAGEAEDLGGATSLSSPQAAPSGRRWTNTATMEAVADDTAARPPDPPVDPAPRPPIEAGRPPMGAARLPPNRRPASMTMTIDEMEDPVAPEPEAPQLPPVPAARPPVSRVAPPPPPPPLASPAPRMSTEDLLAKVRSSGSGDRATAGSPAPSEVIEKILHSSGNRQMRAVSMPAVVPGAARPASAPPPPEPAPTPGPAPAAVAPAPPVPPAAAPSAPPAGPPPAAAPRPGGLRPPDPIKSSARGEPVAVRLGRAPGLHGARRRLPGQTTLAEAVHLLVGQVVPLRVTPDGRLAGWYRIGPEAGPLPPDRKLESLDDETNHVFHPIDNALVVMEIEAPGVVLRLPVGSAVPVVSLVDSLAQMLALPAGEWVLSLDGTPLDPFDILADHPPGRKLSLKKA